MPPPSTTTVRAIGAWGEGRHGALTGSLSAAPDPRSSAPATALRETEAEPADAVVRARGARLGHRTHPGTDERKCGRSRCRSAGFPPALRGEIRAAPTLSARAARVGPARPPAPPPPRPGGRACAAARFPLVAPKAVTLANESPGRQRRRRDGGRFPVRGGRRERQVRPCGPGSGWRAGPARKTAPDGGSGRACGSEGPGPRTQRVRLGPGALAPRGAAPSPAPVSALPSRLPPHAPGKIHLGLPRPAQVQTRTSVFLNKFIHKK